MSRRALGRAAATAGVIAVVVVAQLGLVLAPSQLGEHPMMVLALRPTPAFLVLIAGAVPPVTALVVAALGRTAVDLAYFAVARHGALPVVQRFGVGRSLNARLSAPAASRGLLAVLFFWSSTPLIAALGLGRTPAVQFIAVTAAGNLATSTAYLLFGRRFAGALQPVTAWISGHAATLTIGLIAVVALAVAGSLRRPARRSAP